MLITHDFADWDLNDFIYNSGFRNNSYTYKQYHTLNTYRGPKQIRVRRADSNWFTEYSGSYVSASKNLVNVICVSLSGRKVPEGLLLDVEMHELDSYILEEFGFVPREKNSDVYDPQVNMYYRVYFAGKPTDLIDKEIADIEGQISILQYKATELRRERRKLTE